jgi:hypothetical protein
MVIGVVVMTGVILLNGPWWVSAIAGGVAALSMGFVAAPKTQAGYQWRIGVDGFDHSMSGCSMSGCRPFRPAA